jgi:predicted secreted protein
MPRQLPVFAAWLAGALLVACRGPAVQAMSAVPNPSAVPGNQGAAPVTLTPRNATLTVQRDQTVSIVMKGLATAGYEWTVVEGSFDAKVIAFKGKRIGPILGEAMPGNSATEIFDFVGLAAGRSQVTLVNARPWEGRQPDSETATFTVAVP